MSAELIHFFSRIPMRNEKKLQLAARLRELLLPEIRACGPYFLRAKLTINVNEAFEVGDTTIRVILYAHVCQIGTPQLADTERYLKPPQHVNYSAIHSFFVDDTVEGYVDFIPRAAARILRDFQEYANECNSGFLRDLAGRKELQLEPVDTGANE